MMPHVSGLSTRFALAVALSAARSLLTSQPVGGRWLGGIGRILFTQRQLPLQIRDLLLCIRDLLLCIRDLLFSVAELLFAFGQLVAKILDLLLLPLDLPVQFLAAGLLGVPIGIRRGVLSSLPAASPCRTHPPYVKRFGSICPAKSMRAPELLPRDQFGRRLPRPAIQICESEPCRRRERYQR